MDEQRRTRVAVVFGGRSSEHAISCVTAGGVISAIDPERYEVVPIGITRAGTWVSLSGSAEHLAIVEGQLPEVDDAGAALALAFDATNPGLVELSADRRPRALGEVDVFLPLLHGPFGEDGTIQGLLELAGVPYAGAGVFASAAGMDKVFMKLLLAGQGFDVGRFVAVTDRQWRLERKRVLDDIETLGGPIFVKPARAGSSVGISKVQDAADSAAVIAAVEAAREHDPKLIVEAAVAGREIECGVMEAVDGGAPDASVPAEILVDSASAFYDFEAKYLAESDLAIPADLPADVSEEIRRLAVEAFDAIGCEGLARVDFFYTESGGLVLNELNTMPGFTPASAFPRMWAHTGLDYPDLVDRIIRTGLRRGVGLR